MTGGLGFALLRPSKTPTQLEARFRAMNLKHTMFKKENDVTASPFGKNFLEKSIAPYFAGITSVIGLLILLTGLLNFFQFLTGSYLNRSHEFGIRKATGSGDRQLFGLLFTQAVFISLIAFLFTFSMIEMLSPFLSFSLFNFTLLVERNGRYPPAVFIIVSDNRMANKTYFHTNRHSRQQPQTKPPQHT